MSEIKDYLPHRYPFLLVDKILHFDEEKKSLTAQKNVSFNESYFQGHFPNEEVMPGVLQIEALGQAFIILLKKLGFNHEIFYAAKIQDCNFRTFVKPGDVLKMEVSLIKKKINFYNGYGTICNQNNEIVLNGFMMMVGKNTI